MQQIQNKLCTSQVAFSEVLSTKRLIKTTVKVFVKNDTTIIFTAIFKNFKTQELKVHILNLLDLAEFPENLD